LFELHLLENQYPVNIVYLHFNNIAENLMTALLKKIRQEHQSIAEEVTELFRETHEFLSATTANRQVKAEKQAQELHQFQQNLEQTTHDFLTETAKERFAQAEAQARFLHEFCQELEQTTHDFLAETAKNRIKQAKAQRQNLHQFRQNLSAGIFGTSKTMFEKSRKV
jgi:gas vesicle GvpC-like protein